jgi:hypothetical protein
MTDAAQSSDAAFARIIEASSQPQGSNPNQCDGCRAGIALINGTHRMGREGGYPDLMGCTANLYLKQHVTPGVTCNKSST